MIRNTLCCLLLILFQCLYGFSNPTDKASGTYTWIVTGYDWGPAVNKVILQLEEAIEVTNPKEFVVMAQRKADFVEITGMHAIGERDVIHAYVSDKEGNRIQKGKYITLVLAVAPNLPISSPIQWVYNDQLRGNFWIDYHLTITNKLTSQVWDTPVGKIMPLIDEFDLTGQFRHNEDLTMSYASYTPKRGIGKRPLIIWLHGGGEGGSDPTIPLIANRAANYASDDIQDIFGGAYVLAPQCPGAWMHNTEGVSTRGRENDIYNEGLMALIKEFVANHPNIDEDRIYVGGCSNGGYMSLKLILLYPEYFAAGYISALAYNSEYITDGMIQHIKDVPMWFIHCKDDLTTKPDETVVPVVERLKKAGASNTHFDYYDHAYDITGFFGGNGYHYSGHWSWIYSHTNHSKLEVDGKMTSVMAWMADQKR